MIRLLENTLTYPALCHPFVPEIFKEVQTFHHSLPQYQPTPLVSLSHLAKSLQIGGIYVKDESQRFGLNAFKGLGASYALSKILAEHSNPTPPTVVTATDGNHGKAVAWAAREAGCKAYVFMPKGTLPCRVEAIEKLGNAVVQVTSLNYSDTVKHANAFATQHGYYLVQDTGFEGYKQIPDNITVGYTTMVAEALTQLKQHTPHAPTHVFLQAGVGSMAAGVTAYLADCYRGNLPIVTVIEAKDSACILETVAQNKPVSIAGNPHTIMAGLNCGDANIHIMPILQGYCNFFAACEDSTTELGMRRLGQPLGGDDKIISGESGAVGVGLLIELCSNPQLTEMRHQLHLTENSVVLLFSTEGDTDPENYKQVVSRPL